MIFKDKYWIRRGNDKVISYIGSPLENNVEKKQIRKMLRQRKAWFAMWNYASDFDSKGNWYRCICDIKEYSDNSIRSSNVRHNLRRSLKRCLIKKIDISWLATNGYEVYLKASSNFKNFNTLSLENYKNEMLENLKYDNRIAYGAFLEEKLIAYITLIICEDSIFGDTAFFDPDYSNAYPMYGLYFTVARDALSAGYSAFDRGTKPLFHETEIDSFLLRLGFRLSYCKLGFYALPPFNIAIILFKIIFDIFPKLKYHKYAKSIYALVNAYEIANSS